MPEARINHRCLIKRRRQARWTKPRKFSAAHRKLPPGGAAKDIQRLAAEGFGQLGIAAHFDVSRECFKRWLDEDAELLEAYELGKETERQALHAMVVASAKANKGANINAFFLLKTRHGYVETDNRTKVSVDVALNNVLVVRDHGDDETWAAKLAAQQRALTADSTRPLQLEASTAPEVDAVAVSEPPVIPAPVYAPAVEPAPFYGPVAPSWTAPAHQTVPVTAAPFYGPPVFPWESQPVPAPIYAPESTSVAPVAPSWNSAKWRPRA